MAHPSKWKSDVSFERTNLTQLLRQEHKTKVEQNLGRYTNAKKCRQQTSGPTASEIRFCNHLPDSNLYFVELKAKADCLYESILPV